MERSIHLLTEKTKRSTHSDNFEIFRRLRPSIFETLKEKLKNTIVVDLGGGNSQVVRKIAEESGAKKYVNVDMYPTGQRPDSFAEYIHADIQNYLLKLKKGPGYCFNISGLDEVSFSGDPESLVFLVVQLLNSGNIVFGVNSNYISDYFKDTNMIEIFKDNNYFIFEKR